MAVYVDNARIEWRGRLWCHLVADSITELHRFAKLLGIRREWFQHNASYPHYDLTIETRARALQMGAIEGSRIQIIRCARKLKEELNSPISRPANQLALFGEG